MRVGGKNASLGELIKNLSAVGGAGAGRFCTTTDAYRRFLTENNLNEKIHSAIAGLDTENMLELKKTGAEIRAWIYATPLPADLENDIVKHMKRWKDVAVAVRSSATAEDLPDASFAGQQESFLNIRGADAVIDAVRRVFCFIVYGSRRFLSVLSRLRQNRYCAVGRRATHGA